jgi:hypothetical protein
VISAALTVNERCPEVRRFGEAITLETTASSQPAAKILARINSHRSPNLRRNVGPRPHFRGPFLFFSSLSLSDFPNTHFGYEKVMPIAREKRSLPVCELSSF